MNWFFLALTVPALYAASNHIDKFILDRYFKGGAVGSLVIFSSIFAVLGLPIIYFIDPNVFTLKFIEVFVLVANGTLSVFALILYFHALEKEEASVIVPFFQTVPIITFVLSYFILGETLSPMEIFACLLILLGTFIISLEIGQKIRIKYEVAFLMLSSSFLLAVGSVIFKLIAVEAGFWTSIFWEFFGKFLIGVAIYFLIRSYRNQFLEVFRKNKASVILLNSVNETLFLVADGLFGFVSLLAPLALVATLNGLQPFFVLVFGIIITLLFPKVAKEKIGKYDLLQKTIAIILIVLGTYLIRGKI